MSYREEKRVLTPRGAPIRLGIDPQRLQVLNKIGNGKNQTDQCDSGLGDSFKSQEGSFERGERETTSLLQELSMEEDSFVSDDDFTKNRHPGPCQSVPTTIPAPLPVHNSQPQMSPIENVMNFAQSNDFRYLLAPYRKYLRLQNEDGDTPLHLAIIHNALKNVEAFISIAPGKECLDIFNYLRQTPLHLAVITKQLAVVNCLLSSGASIDLVDRHGKTALHLACERGDMACIEVLTRPLRSDSRASEEMRDCVGRMLDARDYNGFSALQLAAKENCVDAVGLLINLGANVDLPDGTAGRTVVHHAVESKNLGMIRVLLFNYKANVNAQRFDDCTPLHIAAGLGLLNITALLLAAGADLSITNDENETPLDHATEEVLNYLKCYL